jgi:hypothetical protein
MSGSISPEQAAFFLADDVVFMVATIAVALGIAFLGGFSGRYRWIGYSCMAIATGLLMYYEQVVYNKLFPGASYRLF